VWISPTYEHRFVSTEERAEFIKNNYSDEIFNAYSRLQIGAAQADFWRVLVLNKCGGVYMDIDAHTLTSLDKIIAPDDEDVYILTKDKGLSNYFIASMPNNPNMQLVIDNIMKNIAENTLKSVFDLTGPSNFNKTLDLNKVKKVFHRNTCIQGTFTNEYFQYIDKAEGKWTKAQHKKSIVN
jgi:mannosyltransferase OCH1-like enzyme